MSAHSQGFFIKSRMITAEFGRDGDSSIYGYLRIRYSC